MPRSEFRLRGLVLIGLASLLLSGCGLKKENEQLKAENQKLSQEKSTLQTQAAATSVESAEMKSTLDDVERGLEELRIKELKAIKESIEVVQEGKAKSSKKQQLKQELDDIRKAVRQNLDKLDKLEKQRKELSKKNSALEKKVGVLETLAKELRAQLEEKDALIVELQQKVLNLTETVATQATAIKEKEGTIDTQTKELNKAYVAIATKKALKEKGLIEKKGSVLGLGGGWLRTGKFDPEIFREIDVTKETEFSIGAAMKKIRVMSDHPKESYELSEPSPGATTLKVTDPATFWRGSKYLVVMLPD